MFLVRVAFIFSLAVLGGCTVQPLYGSGSATSLGQPRSLSGGEKLASILIEPPNDRVSQEVTNHLAFMFYGGGQPGDPQYRLRLRTVSRAAGATIRQSGGSLRPTATNLTLRGYYSLTAIESGETVADGQHVVVASFDIIRGQQYSALRAERDAEDRAARELAEVIRLSIGGQLTRIQP